MDAAPPQPAASPLPLPIQPNAPTAWPRSAQWATAFLLGAAVTSLTAYVWSCSRFGSRPTEVDRGAARAYRVDLNKANRAELQQLPGVGEQMASRIEERRRNKGPFRKVEEVTDVRGIGPATRDRFQDWVAVDAEDLGEEDVSASPTGASARRTNSHKKLAPATPIDINRASFQDLQRLDGIGPALAQRIIDERTHKAFEKVEDICRVSGIKEGILKKVRPYIMVGEPISEHSEKR
jgi:competence ComEA-like helix-hairpin-helix protein